MFGNMMHRPLSIIEILRFAVEAHPKAEVVSVRTEGDIHRYTYPECYSRVGKLAHALAKLGVKTGDRVCCKQRCVARCALLSLQRQWGRLKRS